MSGERSNPPKEANLSPKFPKPVKNNNTTSSSNRLPTSHTSKIQPRKFIPNVPNLLYLPTLLDKRESTFFCDFRCSWTSLVANCVHPPSGEWMLGGGENLVDTVTVV